MLQEINEILRVQSRPKRDTEEKSRMLLDYTATYPNEIISYKYRDMVLHVYADAAYLTIPDATSCYAGNFYMSDWPSPGPIKPNSERNGPIHMECKTIRNVLFSADEAKTGDTFNNGKTATGMRPYPITLDHEQPATPLKTDNYTTEGFVNLGMKPKRTKSCNMK